MGNKAGWLTLYAGIAGGADIILIPELPYTIDNVCAAVEKRAGEGKTFSILAVAEGVYDAEEARMKKKERAPFLELALLLCLRRPTGSPARSRR